jgi:hypothetical protein
MAYPEMWMAPEITVKTIIFQQQRHFKRLNLLYKNSTKNNKLTLQHIEVKY